MPNSELTSVLFVLLLLVGFAQLFGYLFVKMRQPKVVGEILKRRSRQRHDRSVALCRPFHR